MEEKTKEPCNLVVMGKKPQRFGRLTYSNWKPLCERLQEGGYHCFPY